MFSNVPPMRNYAVVDIGQIQPPLKPDHEMHLHPEP
jgi:hypothetical protein